MILIEFVFEIPSFNNRRDGLLIGLVPKRANIVAKEVS